MATAGCRAGTVRAGPARPPSLLAAASRLLARLLGDAGRPAQGVRIGEESLLHLVRGVAQDDRFPVVLRPHLLERVERLHLVQEALEVLAGLHLEKTDRAGELERLLLAQQHEHLALHLHAALVGPLVEHALRHEQVVSHARNAPGPPASMTEVSFRAIPARGPTGNRLSQPSRPLGKRLRWDGGFVQIRERSRQGAWTHGQRGRPHHH